MKIAVTGASGLIGGALLAALRADGHEVLQLVRRTPRTADEHRWDPQHHRIDPALLADVDAVDQPRRDADPAAPVHQRLQGAAAAAAGSTRRRRSARRWRRPRPPTPAGRGCCCRRRPSATTATPATAP